jgi:hypothetical protein
MFSNAALIPVLMDGLDDELEATLKPGQHHIYCKKCWETTVHNREGFCLECRTFFGRVNKKNGRRTR